MRKFLDGLYTGSSWLAGLGMIGVLLMVSYSIVGRLAGFPVMHHCRIDTDLSGDEVRLVNQVATAVICVSKGVRDSMEAQGVDADLLCFVHNGVDLEIFLGSP